MYAVAVFQRRRLKNSPIQGLFAFKEELYEKETKAHTA